MASPKQNPLPSPEVQLSPPPSHHQLWSRHTFMPPTRHCQTRHLHLHLLLFLLGCTSQIPALAGGLRLLQTILTHLLSMPSNSMSLPGSQSYSYCNGTTTYQEQSQGAGFTYVRTTLIHSMSNSASNFSYSDAHGSFGNHDLPHINSTATVIHNTCHNSESSISGITSRHSILHISHLHSYSQAVFKRRPAFTHFLTLCIISYLWSAHSYLPCLPW
jgi:hypothetical protein